MAKILIVDDEPRIRELISEHLQHEGFACEEATDGSAALAALSVGGIDLVILDVMMPLSLIHILRGGEVVLSGAADDIRQKEGQSLDAVFREVFKCSAN